VQTAFPFVVFGAVAFSVVACVGFLISSGSVYDEIGQGEFSRDSEHGGAPSPHEHDTPAGRAEQELEIRQMLSARSERLVRTGQPALDVEAEVARLTGRSQPGARDPGLSDEVRQLVVARNERRVRKGLEPLEVEAEVARTLEELDR
jgi:hypothetical protein